MKPLFLLFVFAIFTAVMSACSVPSGNAQGTGKSMIGIWMAESISDPVSKNNEPTVSHNLTWIEILSDGRVMTVRDINGKVVEWFYGRLDNPLYAKTTFRYDQEIVANAVKAGDISEEAAQELMQTTCDYKLSSEDILSFACQEPNASASEGPKFKRIETQERDQLKEAFSKAAKFLAQEMPQLKKGLSGKKFSLVQKSRTDIDLDTGKKIEKNLGPDEIAKSQDEEGSGADLSIEPLRLRFSEDLKSVMINEKRNHRVEFEAATNFSFVAMETLYEREPNRFYRTFFGKIVFTPEGFEIREDKTAFKVRTLKVWKFKQN